MCVNGGNRTRFKTGENSCRKSGGSGAPAICFHSRGRTCPSKIGTEKWELRAMAAFASTQIAAGAFDQMLGNRRHSRYRRPRENAIYPLGKTSSKISRLLGCGMPNPVSGR